MVDEAGDIDSHEEAYMLPDVEDDGMPRMMACKCRVGHWSCKFSLLIDIVRSVMLQSLR